jgi:glycosyltransferase involved in cell wall biosynthesis
MIISDGPFSGTGFGTEAGNIFYRLAQTGEFDITWFALTNQGYPVVIPDSVFPHIPHKGGEIRVVGTRGDPHDFGASAFPKHYMKYNPEIVFFMGDPRNIAGYVSPPFDWKAKLHFPLFMYCTLDGLPFKPSWMQYLSQVNVLVSMTEWAQMEFVKQGLAPAMIHHGVNWEWWANSKQLKQKIRRKYRIPEDTTLFISWDVAQHRKRTDALLRAWRDAHPETKKMKLLLYTDWEMGNNLGWDIEDLIKQYNVPRETIISPKQLTGTPKWWEVPENPNDVLEIARMADAYLSTTSGEGFGKCSLEALSLGMPVAITDYSACPEVCKKGSILVPIDKRMRMDDRRRSVDAGLVNEAKFTEAILRLYENPDEREELGKQGREWAREFDYDTKIVPQWRNLFNEVTPEKIMMKELLQL